MNEEDKLAGAMRDRMLVRFGIYKTIINQTGAGTVEVAQSDETGASLLWLLAASKWSDAH